MSKFTAKVASGGLLNIPQNFEDMYDIEKGDLLELEVVKHKKEDGEVQRPQNKDEATAEQ